MLTLAFVIIKIAIKRFGYPFDCRQISLTYIHPDSNCKTALALSFFTATILCQTDNLLRRGNLLDCADNSKRKVYLATTRWIRNKKRRKVLLNRLPNASKWRNNHQSQRRQNHPIRSNVLDPVEHRHLHSLPWDVQVAYQHRFPRIISCMGGQFTSKIEVNFPKLDPFSVLSFVWASWEKGPFPVCINASTWSTIVKMKKRTLKQPQMESHPQN